MKFVGNKKYILAGMIALLLVLLMVSGLFVPIVGLVGMGAVVAGLGYLIYSIIRKKNKKKAIGILFSGIVMFAFAGEYTEVEDTSPKVEVKQTGTEKENETKAKEEQVALKKEQEKKEEAEKQARQLDEAESALELAESKPTRENYDKAFTLISSLDNEEESFSERLAIVEETVQVEEEKIQLAEAAVERAEQEETRETVDEAHLLASGLLVQKDDFNTRLQQVDSAVVEKERVIAEKAEQDRKAEEERKAEAEKQAVIAAQKAEEERQAAIAAQQAEESRAAQEQKAAQVASSPEITNVVYIAPQSGTKYHFDPNCRGLNNANSVVEISMDKAQSQGYELCGHED